MPPVRPAVMIAGSNLYIFIQRPHAVVAGIIKPCTHVWAGTGVGGVVDQHSYKCDMHTYAGLLQLKVRCICPHINVVGIIKAGSHVWAGAGGGGGVDQHRRNARSTQTQVDHSYR